MYYWVYSELFCSTDLSFYFHTKLFPQVLVNFPHYFSLQVLILVFQICCFKTKFRYIFPATSNRRNISELQIWKFYVFSMSSSFLPHLMLWNYLSTTNHMQLLLLGYHNPSGDGCIPYISASYYFYLHYFLLVIIRLSPSYQFRRCFL